MKNVMKNIIFIFVLSSSIAIGVFCWANFARAADSNLIITEVMYDPEGTDTGHEWVEVYNNNPDSITIKSGSSATSWRFIDQFQNNLPSTSHKHTFSGDITVKSHEFLIISNNPDIFQQDYPDNDFTGKVVKASFSLPNSESTIALSDNGASTWFSTVSYSSAWGASDNGKTLEKIDFSGGNESSNWQESFTEKGTPGEKSSTAPPAVPKITYPTDIKINELFPAPSTDESDNEFIELYNGDSKNIDLKGWLLEDRVGNTYVFSKNPEWSGKYTVIYRKDFGFALNDTGGEELSLKNPDGENVSQVSYSGTAKKDYSYALYNGTFSWTSTPTPGEENMITTPVSDEKNSTETETNNNENISSDEKVYLNEILPNPKGGSDDEYIEIASSESGPVDLFGWRLKDGSKSKGYQFKEHIVLNSGEYFAIYHPDSKIALNNSNESVNLYNPQGEVVSSAAFDKSQKNASFNFDGENWKWSKYLTPGKENKFDSEPSVKITKPKHAYKDLYTDFSAKTKDKETKKLRYAWDFGDGKKSYLAKTSHKYLDTGKYTVTLTVDDDFQTVEKSFVLAVKNYPRPDLEIEKIVPNPVGNDSDGEIVEIRNNSGKKIELQGWKIASGSDDKIYNHPISGGISLGPNETKTITREICKFSLNNQAGRIQLVMPDEKVIDEVGYAKEKISEGEAYAKIDGQWQWISPEASQTDAPEETDDSKEASDFEDTRDEGSDEQLDGEILGAADENDSYHAPPQTGYTSEDEFIFLKLFGLLDYKLQNTNYCPINEFPKSLAFL